MTEKHGFLGAISLAALMVTGCSGGLGDGVKLETVEIRGSSVLDSSGDTLDNEITMGRCIATSVSIFTTYSDGEAVSQRAGRAKWTSSDESKIIIINTGDPETSSNQQFPLAIAATDANAPVTLTANFAGIEATTEVTVLPSMLMVEPEPKKVVPGIPTTLTAVLAVGTGSGAGFVPVSVSALAPTAEPAAANLGVKFSVVGTDIEISGTSNNQILASEASSTTATVTAELTTNFPEEYTTAAASNPDFRALCGSGQASFQDTFDVIAEEPSGLEVVPTFVSPNSMNKSSANSLFLASSTTAQVRVNALFSGGLKQQVNSFITWMLPDDAPTTDPIAVPGDGSSLITVDEDDHLQANDPELIAVLSREGFTDIQETLVINVTNYAGIDTEVVTTAPDGGVLRRSASTPQQVLGLFGNPDVDQKSADLVLDLGAGLGSVAIASQRDGSSESSSVAFATPVLAARSIDAQEEVILALVDEVAETQTLTFTYTAPDDDDANTVEESPSIPVTYTRSSENADDIGASPALTVVESGGVVASTTSPQVCIELGQTKFLEALVAVPSEEIVAGTPSDSAPIIVTDSSIWTLDSAAPASLTVTTNGSRGTLTANGSDTGPATVSVRYINPQDFDSTTTDVKVDVTQTLSVEVMDVDQCM